jgi:predicted NUDIX family NTP pyrophosphohydrolase
MPKESAGIIVWRRRGDGVEIFLVHPGGPFWAKKDRQGWSIPKGEVDPGEATLAAALREFKEETGQEIAGDFIALPRLKPKSGKILHAWAIEGEVDAERIVSNEFALEWPPRSGVIKLFPEVDRAAWFALEAARERLHAGQVPLLDALLAIIPCSRR